MSVLARLLNSICRNKKRVLMKTCIESQFGYCPLIWMFHSRGVSNKVSHLHARLLRIFYKDNISSFEDLLKRDQSFTIHQINNQSLQSLAIESFKVKGNLLNIIIYIILQTRKINFVNNCLNINKFGLNLLRYFCF